MIRTRRFSIALPFSDVRLTAIGPFETLREVGCIRFTPVAEACNGTTPRRCADPGRAPVVTIAARAAVQRAVSAVSSRNSRIV
jgi:hypothetical protein